MILSSSFYHPSEMTSISRGKPFPLQAKISHSYKVPRKEKSEMAGGDARLALLYHFRQGKQVFVKRQRKSV